MHLDIFTLFPDMFHGPLDESILARARARGLLDIALHNPRAATADRHHVVDDYPYGGGAGMVIKPDPLFAAVEAIHAGGPIILLGPAGRVFDQALAQALAQEERITLIWLAMGLSSLIGWALPASSCSQRSSTKLKLMVSW